MNAAPIILADETQNPDSIYNQLEDSDEINVLNQKRDDKIKDNFWQTILKRNPTIAFNHLKENKNQQLQTNNPEYKERLVRERQINSLLKNTWLG